MTNNHEECSSDITLENLKCLVQIYRGCTYLVRVSPNFMLHNVFISLQHVLQNVCCFCVDLILYLFISHVSWKLNIIEHT